MPDATALDRPLPGVGPIQAYRRFWLRYAVFSGRASRSEYWWSVLANAVVSAALGVLAVVLLAIAAAVRDQAEGAAIVLTSLGAVLAFLLAVLSLALVVPAIAVAVRRLHDADLSGLLYLLSLVPAGGLVLLALHCLPSNPRGGRFDHGATAWRPEAVPATGTPVEPAPALSAARPIAGFETWPAPAVRGGTAVAAPATAPLPSLAGPLASDAPPLAPAAALTAAWSAVGVVEELHPRLTSRPSWRRQQYLRVLAPNGVRILTTQGLGDAEGPAALGPGAEVYLAEQDLAAAPQEGSDDWALGVVAGVALRVGASGMNLPAELERSGTLSMSLPVPGAPAGWAAPDGSVGVLLGIGLPGVPETVATAQGEVRLVGLAMLHPAELQRILAGGAGTRAAAAARLAALSPAELVSPDRPEV